MQKRHADRQLYFNEQSITTQKYVIPFIEKHKPITADSHILEIGCGEGGNIKPFLDLGCKVTGIDINGGQIAIAKEIYGADGVTYEPAAEKMLAKLTAYIPTTET